MNSHAANRLLRAVERRPRAKVSLFMADDVLKGMRLRLGRIDTKSGTLHSRLGLDDSLAYVEEVVDDYRRYGGIDRFHGTVAELGPGDNAAVALLIRAAGADRVDLVDRYAPRHNPQRESEIYRALSIRHDLDRFRGGAEWNRDRLQGITWHTGSPAEAFFAGAAQAGGDRYDFIVSRAVMEHLYDPLSALRDMVTCLRPGGIMLHKIDMRDHGMFSTANDELTWLELPRWVWRRASVNSGRANRTLAHRYREILDPLVREGTIRYRMPITQIVQVGGIRPHREWQEIDSETRARVTDYVETRRAHLSREFRQVSARDLATTGIFLRVQKQSWASEGRAECQF